MCLACAALSSVLTCRAINWLMEYIWYSAGVVSQEKVLGGEGEELEVELQLQVAREESSLQVWLNRKVCS